jgi:hypothetical protein
MYVFICVCMYYWRRRKLGAVLQICMYVFIYERMYVLMHVLMYVSMYVSIYVFMYVFMYVFLYVSMYASIYVHIHLCLLEMTETWGYRLDRADVCKYISKLCVSIYLRWYDVCEYMPTIVCMYVYDRKCMYTSMIVCMYVCTCVYLLSKAANG